MPLLPSRSTRSLGIALVAASACLGLGACVRATPAVAPSPTSAPNDASTGHAAAPAPADDTRKVTHRFHQGRDYGSDAEFNPLAVVVNEGFDQLRTSTQRSLLRFPYRQSAAAVLHSLANPERAVRHYGYRRWLRNEVFPVSLKSQGGGQWWPNYQLHLFGAGMTYVALTEWYEQRGYRGHPRLLAGATTMGFHFLNEMVESGPQFRDNVDAITDLLLFDPLSILLWNQSWMLRAFDGRLQMADWMGQASVGQPGTTIENACSMVMLRAPLPRTDSWKVLTTAGNAFLLGISRRLGDEYWVTASGGLDPVDNPVIDPRTFTKTATLEPNVGLFLDRNGSLLVSFISKGGSDNGPTLNVYPGVVRLGFMSPGLWAQGIRSGGLRFGIVSRIGVGVSGFAFTPRRSP